MLAPVCVNKTKEFANSCIAENEGYFNWKNGKCPKKKDVDNFDKD